MLYDQSNIYITSYVYKKANTNTYITAKLVVSFLSYRKKKKRNETTIKTI